MACVVPDRDWRVVDGDGALSSAHLDSRGYAMRCLLWLGNWSGWAVVMACSLSIHLSGHVAYQAGARSAAERPDAMSLALRRVFTHLSHGSKNEAQRLK